MATIMERTTKDGKKRYTAQIRMKGAKPINKTFQTKGEANAFIQDTESDIRKGNHLPTQESQRRTLAELIDRYLDSQTFKDKAENTRYCQAAQLEHWRTTLGHKTLAVLSGPTIADERDRLLAGTTRNKVGGKLALAIRRNGAEAAKDIQNNTRSGATANRYLAVLSHCLSYGRDELHWIPENPCRFVRKVKENNERCRVLSDEERKRLLNACRESKSKDLYSVVVLLLATGGRKNEILQLRWSDVKFDRRVVVFENTKNKDRRVIPIRGEAERILETRSKIRRMDSDYVFPAPLRHGKPPRPLCIRSAWDTALDKAGIEDFTVHDLRHCAASTWAMNGASLAELAALLGHRQLRMVQRYAHFCEGHGGDLIERVDAKVFEKAEAKKA